MRSVDDNCRVDLSELASSVLEVDMAALDNARMQINAEGEVRAVYEILFVRDRMAVTRHTLSGFAGKIWFYDSNRIGVRS